MLFKSGLVTQVSGSIGGITGSHNRGGMYFRSRTIPTNPSTLPQVTQRAIFGIISNAWASLTSAQRTAWNLYASNVPTVNALGDAVQLSGQQWFVACNSLRVRAGLSFIDDGPTVFTMATMTLPSLSNATEATQEFDITFTNTDDWATEVGGALIVQVSKPQGTGITSFKGPWRFCDSIDGAAVAPTSPATISSSYAITSGQQIWSRVTAVRADGRISPPIVLGPTDVGV